MVNKLSFNRAAVYLCEVCGSGYRSLDTAEHCEQHCSLEMESSPIIRQKAIYEPNVEIIPVSSSHSHRRLSKVHA